MKILLTGFEPFGGDAVNASQIAVEGCTAPEGVELHKLIVPVVFGLAAEVVAKAIDEIRPDVVICVGEAGGRDPITPERVAINVNDARIPDNAGNQPVDEKIAEYGPDAYFSTLPIKKMTALMQEAGFNASVSNTAGTFVCNSLMYGVLHYIAGAASFDAATLAGFIHVPADRPVTNPDGSITPVPETSAKALSCALRAFI